MTLPRTKERMRQMTTLTQETPSALNFFKAAKETVCTEETKPFCLKAEAEHAALVAVAEAAEKLSQQLRRELEDEGEEAAMITALVNLAAVRAGQPMTGSEVAK
jgi:hypothetical protein